MNLEQRTVETLGPWYRALFEEPADSRSVQEWGEVTKKALLVAGLVLGSVVGTGLIFGADSIPGPMMGLAWLAIFASSGLAIKTAVAEYRTNVE